MTENEIKMAQYLRKVVLPKLQEIQRDVYFDIHIVMDVDMHSYMRNLSAYLVICTDAETSFVDSKICSRMFYFYTCCSKRTIDKELRGVSHFIKNWQQRLA